jgi:hypothetical protein
LHSGLQPARKAIQFIAPSIVPQEKVLNSALFPMNFWNSGEPVEAESVCCRGTGQGALVRSAPRFDPTHQRRCCMTLTVAHISPIMSVIAGVLILIMPRLLNLVVAIFLILNGLIGLGLLRWLHL